jgi:DNA-directed RNA polymerase subunit K/omega
MIQDDITELRRRVGGGKYLLTRCVAERAKQLQNGAVPLAEENSTNSISVAIQEIVKGNVAFNFADGKELNLSNKTNAKATK